jgi:iron complex outermembrane recepter protein
MNISKLYCGIAIAALGAAHPAFAQQAADNDDAQADTQGLDEIVVTAQRREENLQKAAVAVSAVSGDDLVNAGVTDPAGLSKLVPSLVVQPAGGSSINLYLRGVGTLQGNAFGENPIAMNFGGVYIARPSSLSGMFYDLERVEVVKGPQGTLYGRNATGGAVNVIPRKPQLGQVGGDLMVEYGNYNSIKAGAAFNMPIGDTIALRVAGQIVDRDGYLSDGYQDDKGHAVRASLLIEPSDAWSVLLVGDYFHQGGKGMGSVLAPGQAFPTASSAYTAPPISDRIGASDPRSIAALRAYAGTLFAPPFCGGFGGFITSGCVVPPNGDGFVDGDFYGISATVEGETGIGTLTIVPAYRVSKNKFDAFVPGFLTRIDEENKQTSLEVRLASDNDGPLGYVLGGYYFTEDQDALNYFYQGELATTRFTPRLETTSLAAFGQLTFSLSDNFRLVAGGRFTKEERTQSTALASGGRPGPVQPALGNPFAGDLEFERFTWKLGAEFDLGPDSLLYANVATGFKAGGFFVSAPPNNVYQPEKLTAYTVGSKNRFFNDRLQLNVEAFYWDYKDQQISFVGPVQSPTLIVAGGVTVNAGQARMYGFDASLLFEVVPNGVFSADVQYLNGKYNSLSYTAISASGAPIRNGCSVSNARIANPGTPSPARLFDIDCSGRPTINSPKWSMNLGYEHSFPIGTMNLVLNGGTRIESSRFTNVDFLPEQKQAAYMTSDASISLKGADNAWTLTGFVNNIEDETILGGGSSRPILQTVYVTLRPPRTYGLRASIRF